jgi:hypothetical protein
MTRGLFSRQSGGAFIASVLVAALSMSVAAAQSLGELARKEEERRKSIKTPGKLYTNESLRPDPAGGSAAGSGTATGTPSTGSSPAAVPPSPSGTPPAAPGAQPVPEEPEDGTRDEAYWRERIQTARDALQRARMFADALQSRINALSTDFAARDDPAQRDVIGSDRQKALAELDRVKQEIEQHTKAIATIQDDARRAGVPPGWLR